MILQESYTLSNGVRIPKLGLGTWFIEDGAAAQAVRDAVQLGYRLIDTAQAYGNERGVGEGVRGCGLARGELFVASKVAAELKTYDEAAHVWHIFAIRCPRRDELQAYLKQQGIETLIHYPTPPHQQGAYAEWKEQSYPITELIHREELSLPISPVLTDEEAARVAAACNRFGN